MRKLLIATAAFVVVVSQVTAASAYDDPAIVVCETQLKAELDPTTHRELVPSGAKYERLSATLDQSTATIRYRVTIATTAPREGTFTCLFALTRKSEGGDFDGFIVVLLWPDECMKTFSQEGQRHFYERYYNERSRSTQKWMVDERKKMLEQCTKKYMAQVAEKHLLLSKTGLYPIRPAETNLRDTGQSPVVPLGTVDAIQENGVSIGSTPGVYGLDERTKPIKPAQQGKQ